MTITAQTARSGPYSGNGSTTVFDYTFRVDAESDLVVTIRAADNTETVQTLTTDYTVSGVGNANGGSVTMTVAPAVGEQLVITRDIPLTQEIDLQNRGGVNPETLEAGFDKLTQIIQDLSEEFGRTLKVDAFDASTFTAVLPSKTERAGNYFAFDGDGNPVMTSGTANAFIVSAFAETLLDDGDAAAMLTTLGLTATAAEINLLDGVTWTLTDYNTLTATATELNLLDGITALTGADTEIVTGTAGTDGQLAQWNADGDVVGYTTPTQDTATWEAGTDTTDSLVSAADVKSAIDAQVPGVLNASGSAPVYGCRAWVNFNGTGTVAIRASGNVSSITDNGSGSYTVNFTVAMPDTNYAVITTGSNDFGDTTYRNTTNKNFSTATTSSCGIYSQSVNSANQAREDAGNINVAIFR